MPSAREAETGGPQACWLANFTKVVLGSEKDPITENNMMSYRGRYPPLTSGLHMNTQLHMPQDMCEHAHIHMHIHDIEEKIL